MIQMSEKEKKAIEDIKELVYGNISEITIYDKDGYTMWNNDLDIILNLIEKQQNRIDELEKALIEEDFKYRNKINKAIDKLKEDIKK